MSIESNLLESPVGELLFLATERPVPKQKGSDELVYTAKIAYDNKKAKTFLAKIAEINDAKVVTAATYRGKDQAIKELLATGKSIVSANSNYKPKVYDKAGNEMEEAPLFFKDSTGTAQMIVQPAEGARGNTVYLVAVTIHNVESPERSTEGSTSREEQLERIRAQLRESAEK